VRKPGAMIPQADPGLRFAAHGAAIQEAFRRVLESRTFILGNEVAQFEAEFARYIGVAHAVGVSSGTDALRFALAALGVKPGDQVITVAMTHLGTAVAIENTGATPVFVDVDAQSRCIDPQAVEAAITTATTAIIPVHLHGYPAPMEAIIRIAARHGLAVLEDCAHAHGATIEGRKTGAFGHAAAFSFYPTKNLGALGDAGMVATNDPALAEHVRRLRNYGQDQTGACVDFGGNGRLDEMQAAFLRVLLPGLDHHNAERRKLAAAYRVWLTGASIGLPPEHEGAVYHQFAIEVENRDAVRHRILNVHGIGTGLHYAPAVHQHPHMARPGLSLPSTERLAGRTLSLPIQPEVTQDNVARIANAVLESIH
jgi:dTDP-3-amino-3,4,6-trideoxy-alpha-D-glucose transaminase